LIDGYKSIAHNKKLQQDYLTDMRLLIAYTKGSIEVANLTNNIVEKCSQEILSIAQNQDWDNEYTNKMLDIGNSEVKKGIMTHLIEWKTKLAFRLDSLYTNLYKMVDPSYECDLLNLRKELTAALELPLQRFLSMASDSGDGE